MNDVRRFRWLPTLALAVSLSACGPATTDPATRPSPSPVAPTTSSVSTPTDQPVSASPQPTPGPSIPDPSAAPSPTAEQTSAVMADWTMTTAGWGPVRIGSPVPTDLTSQVKVAWECIGPKITDAQGTEKMEFFASQPDGTGPINTLHIIDKTISTKAGIRPGAPLIDLLTTYPHTERFRAPNDGTGDVYVLKDGEVGLFFEISRDDRVVEHISVQRIADFTPFQMQVCGAP